MKEKSITELKDEKMNLSKRSKEIIALAKKEKRMFNAEENEELSAAQIRMAEINLEIEQRMDDNEKKPTRRMGKTNEKFSLRKAIVAQLNGTQQRDVEASVIEDATRLHRNAGLDSSSNLILPMEYRASVTVSGDTDIINFDEDQMEMLLPLESQLVLVQAGARKMTGLVGNIYFPTSTAATVAWAAETAAATDGAPTFAKGKSFSPHRLTAYVDISKQLLIQENKDVEAIIRQLLANAIAQKLESTAFGEGHSVANTPDGMFYNATNKGAMTWANIVAMETAVDTANAAFGNLAYILHPALVGVAKTKVKDASGAGGFIFGNDGVGSLNGYRALRSTNLISKELTGTEYGIAFGNWKDYFLGQWGAMDITVDPYTQAGNGMVRLVVNSYWDMGVIRDESFNFVTMK